MALDDILAAIRVVAAGDALIAPSVTRRLIADFARRPGPAPARPPVARRHHRPRARGADPGRPGPVQPRDRRSSCFISAATAKAHVARLLTKLDARDRVQLVIIAYESGLVSAA